MMKEDYLWDKIGENAEIERLENALKAFRYQESAPPILPSKIIPFEKKTSRGFFRLSFAFAAFAAFLIVCIGVWFHFSDVKTEIASDSPKITSPPNVENTAKEILAEKPADLIIGKIETPKNPIKREVVKVKKIVPQIVRQEKKAARNLEIKQVNDLMAKNQAEKSPVELTKEEKFAYDQLMLALSVTSSKLKLVRDKIDGIEKQNTVLENER